MGIFGKKESAEKSLALYFINDPKGISALTELTILANGASTPTILRILQRYNLNTESPKNKIYEAFRDLNKRYGNTGMSYEEILEKLLEGDATNNRYNLIRDLNPPYESHTPQKRFNARKNFLNNSK